MLKKLKTNEGFTIIEVLIVLAIAALILLIVFLAVPALQRNSRNTQRKNDVAGLLGAVSEFSNNNEGSFPTKCTGTNTATFDNGAAGAADSDAKVGFYNVGCTTGIPTAGNIRVQATATGPGVLNAAAKDFVLIETASMCDTNNDGGAATGSSRQFVAIYEIETSGGNYTQVCQQS